MKRYNQLHLSIMLLTMVAYTQVEADVSTATLGRLFKIMTLASKNAPKSPVVPKVPAKTPAATTPAAITPPTAPLQPLAPVTVSKSSASSSLGGASLVKLDYQVLQLPVTAQMSTVSIVAEFGSTSSAAVVFDTATFTALNSRLQSGHAIIVQVGVTSVDGNLIVYAGLLDENDVDKMFGYAIQQAPAGVSETDLSGFTVTYQFATATTSSTMSLTADQSLFILNPTVSISNQLTTLSVQSVFGSSSAPVVSGPIALDAGTVQAINTALQKGDVVTVAVSPEYMFGLGDMVLSVVDTTSGTELGTVSGPITQAQINAGNFIAYQLNLGLQGQAGQTSFVRGANEVVAFQIPVTSNQSLDYYVNANLSVVLADTETVEAVTINGAFSDGSTSSGFAFTATDLTAINDAIDKGDKVDIVVEQSANGSSLIAYALDLSQQTILATAIDQVTAAQEQLTLDGFVVNYQLTGQAKPTSLTAKLGQSVSFATDGYANVAIPTGSTDFEIKVSGVFLEGGSGIKTSQSMGDAASATIAAALAKQHEVVIGCGYSVLAQKLVFQVYDNTAKIVLVQTEHSSQLAQTGIFVGYTVNINVNQVQVGVAVAGGNTLTLIPVEITAPLATAVDSTSSILNMNYIDGQGRQQPIQTIHILPDFGTNSDNDWISFDLSSVQQGPNSAAGGNLMQLWQAMSSQQLMAINVSYQAPYLVISAWGMEEQKPIVVPMVVPVGSGTLQGISFAYSFVGQTSIPADQTLSLSGDNAVVYMTTSVQQVRLSQPQANQLIPMPSASATLEQLWFSPIFADGSFAELALQAIAPEYMDLINTVISENNGQLLFASVLQPTCVPNVQGSDFIVTAYVVSDNSQGPEELFTVIFPLIQTNKGLYTGNSSGWTTSNITYQFSGQKNATVIGGLSAGNILGIAAAANAPKSVKDLYAFMQKDNVELSPLSWLNANITGMPSYMAMKMQFVGDINFWSNPAGSGANNPVAPDISSIVANGNWESGISFAVLGMDANNNIITDLTKATPASFYVAVYDASSGNSLGGMSIPMSSIAYAGSASNINWTNSIIWTGSGYPGEGGSYPCLFTVTNGATSPKIPGMPKTSAALETILSSLEGKYPGITKFCTQAPPQTFVPVSNAVVALAVYVGPSGGNWNNAANYEYSASVLQNISAATWQAGVIFIPVLLNPNNGAFITDTTSLSGNNPGILSWLLYDLKGNALGELDSADNVWDAGYSVLSIDMAAAGSTPWTTNPPAGQVWIVKFSGAPTFNL